MNDLNLFLPCAGGVEQYLQAEAQCILGRSSGVSAQSGGVAVQASWREVMLLNLHSRLASRVLIGLKTAPYASENDIYEAACDVAWEIWFDASQTFKIDISASRSPLRSLNFAALRVKDAICDRFRAKSGSRPSVDTDRPDARVYVHLSADEVNLYIDTSGEPLFKRGWRQDKGAAPLKENLAAAMLAASGWWALDQNQSEKQPSPQDFPALYDPCCGSGTIVIEAAQIALGLPAGGQRRFAFERLLPYQAHTWVAIKKEAAPAHSTGSKPLNDAQKLPIFGSDVAHRMVDFALRNAQLAGVADYIELRGGDALQRKPPCNVSSQGAMIVSNPPYGERIEIAGVAGKAGFSPPRARESAQLESEDSNFFEQLAAHWKTHYDGWSAHLLVPDMKLPSKMRLKESRRVPLWNGPIECRLFRFDIRGRIEAAVQEKAS